MKEMLEDFNKEI